MNIAVCSSDNVIVNQHFGKTSSFYIYNISKGTLQFVEERKIPIYSNVSDESKQSDHAFPQDKFDAVVELLKDCKRIYTPAMGQRPRDEFAAKGIKVYICTCEINQISTCEGNCKHH